MRRRFATLEFVLEEGVVPVRCSAQARGDGGSARFAAPRLAERIGGIAPSLGITEDPATGSAVAAFAGVAARHAGLADGEHELAIEQGCEMGRPSLMRLAITMRGGTLAGAWIGGDAVPVSEGAIAA